MRHSTKIIQAENNMSKVLVTGGLGFIGSHIVDKLVKLGHKVVVIDDCSTGLIKNKNKKAKLYKYSLCLFPTVRKMFEKEKFQYIFHCAAQINLRQSVEDPVHDALLDAVTSVNLIELCRGFKIKKFIFSSSGGAIYGDGIIPSSELFDCNPMSPYGINKLYIEKYLEYVYKTFGFKYISLRYANVYGKGQNPDSECGVIAKFDKNKKEKRQSIINGDGLQTRDFVHVNDVVSANIIAMGSKKCGSYNIGTSREINILKIAKLLGIKPKFGKGKIGEQRRSCLYFGKALKELKWKPKISIEKGIKMI